MTDTALTMEPSVQAERGALEARVHELPSRRVVLASTALTRGGVWRNVRDLAVLLQSIGMEVQIGLLNEATELHVAAGQAGLAVGDFTRLSQTRTAVWHVHLHWTYDRLPLETAWKRRLFGPTVITDHLPRDHTSDAQLESHHARRRGARTAKTILKRAEFVAADEMIAVGSSSAQFLRDRYRVPARRIRVVHNGIASLKPSPITSSPSEPLRVLAVGNFGRQKGFDVLIRAAALSARDWRVIIAGAGVGPDVLSTTDASPAGNRVEFPGWVDRPQDLMRSSDVICMPSRWESFPYVALEASALGRPIVGSRVDGLDEIVDGTNGILVDADNPAQLAAALDRLDADRELLHRLAARAPARAAKFTLASMLFGTLEAYESAWQARSRRKTWVSKA